METPCIRFKCIQCCLDTEMLLLNEDIERIEGLGFDRSYFVSNIDGWLKLKNRGGRCVFNDGKKCLIYENRPEGCKSYPIIYDEDRNCATIDEDCPHGDEFKMTKIEMELAISIAKKLKDERRKRKLLSLR